MGTVGITESLAELAKVLEFFFKGLAECGLLTTYLVQLQGTTVDFSIHIKYQFLLLQFVRNLQNVLLKIPSIPGHEYNKETSTQTTEETNFIEVNIPNTSTSNVSEQLGSLVEACEFTQSVNSLEWVDAEGRELKGEISASFIAQGKSLDGTTDIIVTCHPATLAAITSHSFVAEVIPTSGTNPILIKQCVKRKSERECSPVAETRSSSEPLTETEAASGETVKSNSPPLSDGASNYRETSLENVTVTSLKSFVTPATARESPNTFKVAFGSEQEMQSLVVETYEGNHGDDCDSIDSSANVVHIVVASAAPSNETSSATSVDEQVKEKEMVSISEADGDAGTNRETDIFICEVCEKTFHSAASLDTHLNMKHRTQGQCDLCLKRFSSVQSLQEHCRMEHGGTGCFNCPVCSKRFMTKLSYRRHMDSHVGKKGAVCDMCGKTFSRTDYLQKHYMIHAGNRPYQCNICPRQFISTSQLKVHQRIHTGVKEHVCEKCQKAFSRADKLKDHMLRHLNIKRFQCSVCKRDYAEKRDLNKHLKVHMT